jgi:hypothetical protein
MRGTLFATPRRLQKGSQSGRCYIAPLTELALSNTRGRNVMLLVAIIIEDAVAR